MKEVNQVSGVFPVALVQKPPCLFVPFFIFQGGFEGGLTRVSTG
jgi:hypothetical protein